MKKNTLKWSTGAYLILIVLALLGSLFVKLTRPDTVTAPDEVDNAEVVVEESTGLIFKDPEGRFTFSYPSEFDFSSNQELAARNWSVLATTSGKVLALITIPKSFEPETNFSDAIFTVGKSSDPQAISSCGQEPDGVTTLINDAYFIKINFGDAGAGNFYETTSYRTLKDNECYSVEYTIHSTSLAAYSPDQNIKEFNREKIEQALEDMVQSFVF